MKLKSKICIHTYYKHALISLHVHLNFHALCDSYQIRTGTDNNELFFVQNFEGAESWMDSPIEYGKGLDQPPTSIQFGPKLMQGFLYEQSPPEVRQDKSKKITKFVFIYNMFITIFCVLLCTLVCSMYSLLRPIISVSPQQINYLRRHHTFIHQKSKCFKNCPLSTNQEPFTIIPCLLCNKKKYIC